MLRVATSLGAMAACGCAALAMTVAAPARAAAGRVYDVHAGDLRQALKSFAAQSDWQVLFTSEIAAGRRTAGFSGVAQAPDALRAILAGAGLTYRIANTDTLLVVEAPTPRADPRQPGAEPAGQSPPAAALVTTQVEEAVVTATRVPEPAGRVPLSVTAQSRRGLDQQGQRVFADLAGAVPALQASQSSSGVSNVVLRAIANTASAATAPTTGFYLDDTPIQKRNVGGFISNNGTPLPPLFDLDRVEVIRGPQGTLFGSSSEGGTIRYITPQPSLSRTSVYIRGEASLMQGGDPTYEGGFALGGPIVEDRLGFRASVYEKRLGGYIDYIDPYTGAERLHNANGGGTRMARLTLAWAPSEASRVTLGYFSSAERSDSNTSSFTLPTGSAIVEQPLCFATGGITPQHPNANPSPVACDSPGVTFRRPGATYGPYPKLKPYDLLSAADPTPTKTNIKVLSLTLDYRFEAMSARSVTSYVHDETRSQQYAGGNEFNLRVGDYLYAGAPASVEFPQGGRFREGLGLSASLPMAGAQGAPAYGFGYGFNRRTGLSQEFRFASVQTARPFTWVAGVFFSDMRGKNSWYVVQNQDLVSRTFYGLTAEQRYGIGTLPDPYTGLPYLYDRQDSRVRDVEVAGFGEGNLWVTDRLRLTAGLRASRVGFDYSQAILGAAAGFAVPSEANRGLSSGRTTETPLTPKIGALYQVGVDDIVYLTASKGYRAGGVNGVLSPALCDPVLGRFGLTSADVPRTFSSDAVWSYEAGGKFRLLQGELQVNADIYRIDWSNIQTAVNFTGCGSPFIVNAGGGKIGGGELEAQARFGRLSLNLAVGYTGGRYTATATAPAGVGAAPLVIALKGQPLPTPPWTVGVGVRYEIPLSATNRFYARADWRMSTAYDASVFGVSGYSPDTARASAVSKVNVRVGLERSGWDLALFALNVLDSHDGTPAGGRSGCIVSGGPDCLSFGQYNPLRTVSWGLPRAIGVQIAYRR
jgi:iron complex outermembrane receptor protein